MTLKEDLVNAVADLDDELAKDIVKRLLDEGISATEIFGYVRDGMTEFGKRFESKEYFLADLIYSGELFEEINKILMPKIKESPTEAKSLGKVVFGTVKNDIHDIGKNIVIGLLKAEGINVIDLGVDQPVEAFIESVKKNNPDIVGLSGLLTLAIESMKKTRNAIKKINPNLPVVIGGGPVDQKVCDHVGADGWAKDAVEAVKLFKKFID
ncbi:MAG: cobalamin-binding protein [Candidatus Lokiarchaeota archaeon]|nr:cobalamin-binding protein [Candidatus Lokiarchaeota archaeon]